MRQLLLLATAVVISAVAAGAQPLIGDIEFFGYGDLDTAAIREGLALAVGDPVGPDVRERIRESVRDATGLEPTNVAMVCCDEAGRTLIFIGIAGTTSKTITYRERPTSTVALAPEIVELSEQLDEALMRAARRGGEAALEDSSLGYALTNDPAAKAIQLEIRDYALAHGPHVFEVLRASWDTRHRATAATIAGYAEHSAEQIDALYQAARDPDNGVRNNATRALGVLVRSDVELKAPVPTSFFMDMMSSGVWTDRNKAFGLLTELTQSRDARLLREIEERSLDALLESARWQRFGHAYSARAILARLAGIEEGAIFQDASTPQFVGRMLARIRERTTTSAR